VKGEEDADVGGEEDAHALEEDFPLEEDVRTLEEDASLQQA